LNTRLRSAWVSALNTRCVSIYGGLAFSLAWLAGCTVQRPSVEPIVFTSATGAPMAAVSSLPVNGVVYLVGVVSNDDEQLGVSWTTNCGSLPANGGTNGAISTACGVIAPAQTLSGPVPTYPTTDVITTYTAPSAIPKGNTVTVTAHATSWPTASSSITLTIVAAPASSP
jgi:hypothetical protein